MSIIDEKRTGTDRRSKSGNPPPGIRERRTTVRRQTTIEEITFSEWAAHSVRFSKRLSAMKTSSRNEEAIKTINTTASHLTLAPMSTR